MEITVVNVSCGSAASDVVQAAAVEDMLCHVYLTTALFLRQISDLIMSVESTSLRDL